VIKTSLRIENLILAVVVWIAAPHGLLLAQESRQTPRTGRSYEVTNLPKTPPPPGPQGKSPAVFNDVTKTSKLDFKHFGSPTPKKYLLETMGGGAGVFDFNNDGRLDLFLTNGAALQEGMPADAIPAKTDPRFWNRLYQQQTDGTFVDVTERAGVRGSGYDMGVAAGDFNNDGFTDLYVTGYGKNHLYQNNGNGTFTDVTQKLGVESGGWSSSAGWFDYDRDGRLDLFVARYLSWDFWKGSLVCGDQRPGSQAYCHPDNFKGTTNLLYHQKSDGQFEDVSVQAKIADPNGKALGVAFADFDNDGWLDIFVANDSVRQSLYRNKTNGTFEDIAVMSGAGYDENGRTFAGMGVDTADYDNDGWQDVLVTTLSNETYPLYHNNKDLSFSWATNVSAIGQITLLYSGWGTRFIDFDNDGWRDIFVAQGHVLDTIEKSTSYLKYKQPPLLMRNTGKSFVNVSNSAGIPFNSPIAARGAGFGDLNNDGQIDVVLNVLNDSPMVIMNQGTNNGWIGVSLVGSKSNRAGLGSRVVITDVDNRKQIFDVSAGGSYLSSNDSRIVGGLGGATAVRSVEVRWPSGRIQTIANPKLKQYLVIHESDGN
jgi:enediyne biosynthesis protein E4